MNPPSCTMRLHLAWGFIDGGSGLPDITGVVRIAAIASITSAAASTIVPTGLPSAAGTAECKQCPGWLHCRHCPRFLGLECLHCMSAPGVYTRLHFFAIASVLATSSCAHGLSEVPPRSPLLPLSGTPRVSRVFGVPVLAPPHLRSLQCPPCPHCLCSASRLSRLARVSRVSGISAMSIRLHCLPLLQCPGALQCLHCLGPLLSTEPRVSTQPRLCTVCTGRAAS